MANKTSTVPIDANLKDESFSSNTHPTLLFAEEAKDYSGLDYKIPSNYGIDTLRLLPVNVNTIFVYWEITDKLLNNSQFETFALKLFELTDGGESEVLGFYFKERVSGKYANAHLPSKNLVATIGGIDANGRFVELIRSNKVKMPNDTVAAMNPNNEEAWMSKHSEWTELIKASTTHFSHAKSSITLVKEMEFLKKYADKAAFGMSSSELVKKD
jgi:hypothetical protein